MKICSKCGAEKSRSEFHKDGTKKDGLRPGCKTCTLLVNKVSRPSPEEQAAYWRAYREVNREKISANRKEVRAALPKWIRTEDSKWYALKERVPPWANREEIKDVYANCPSGHEVDHIVPLKGERVSGLHVAQNLQYLTPAANRAKGNLHTVGPKCTVTKLNELTSVHVRMAQTDPTGSN